VDGDHLLPFQVILEGTAGDAQAPSDIPLGDALLEERAQLLVSDITAPGTTLRLAVLAEPHPPIG
jgi:hypothetical protein